MLVFCCAVKVFIFLVFLWLSFSIIIHYSRGSVKIVFLRIYHRGTYSQRSRLAPFLRALQISRYPHDHSRFVNRFSRNCTNLTNPVRLISPACFVVSWFRGFAESVLQHPFYERHLRNLMKRFCLAAVNFSLNIDRSLLI